MAESVRSAAKKKRSFRERNDSGYESNENDDDYLQRVITNYQRNENIIHVYPVLHGPRSPSLERRRNTIVDSGSVISDDGNSSRRSSISQRPIHRSQSMSPQKSRRVSSTASTQTLKPIIHRRSTLLNPNIGSLIKIFGSPRLNNEDETYISTRFRNQNTSKFVIGTLWNTFALVNNLFLQRPRTRRDAIAGDTSIRADELAHLEELYFQAEKSQFNEMMNEPTQKLPGNSILKRRTTMDATTNTERINNLQSIVFDILSSTLTHRCTCYEDHHLSSCPFYDHSAPYFKPFSAQTERLEMIIREILALKKANRRDASTQSSAEKPTRIFTHMKGKDNIKNRLDGLDQSAKSVATQSSPLDSKQYQYKSRVMLTSSKQIESFRNSDRIDATTQYSPASSENKSKVLVDSSTQFDPTVIGDSQSQIYQREPIRLNAQHGKSHIYVNIPSSLRWQQKNSTGIDASTQFSRNSPEIDFTRKKSCSTQFSPTFPPGNKTDFSNRSTNTEINIMRNISVQTSPVHISSKKAEQLIPSNRNSPETTKTSAQTISSTKKFMRTTIENRILEEKHTSYASNDSTRKKETTEKKLSDKTVDNVDHKLSTTNQSNESSQFLLLPQSSVLHQPTEELQPSNIYDTIEQFANEVASNIVENAVVTATTTPINHQAARNNKTGYEARRRFSLYNNGGGHGKSLLFQTNTFLPVIGLNALNKREADQNKFDRGILFFNRLAACHQGLLLLFSSLLCCIDSTSLSRHFQ